MIAACLAPIEAVSPDLEKQGFFAVGFLDREYSGKRETCWQECIIVSLQIKSQSLSDTIHHHAFRGLSLWFR